MTEINMLELRNDLTGIMERVRNGESFTVTRFGSVVARLTPATATGRAASPESFDLKPASSKPTPLDEEEVTTFGGLTTVPEEGKKDG